jgi:hypothetical protein
MSLLNRSFSCHPATSTPDCRKLMIGNISRNDSYLRNIYIFVSFKARANITHWRICGARPPNGPRRTPAPERAPGRELTPREGYYAECVKVANFYFTILMGPLCFALLPSFLPSCQTPSLSKPPSGWWRRPNDHTHPTASSLSHIRT